MDIAATIKKAYQTAKERNWDTIYWMIDLHSTILKSTYDHSDISTEFYPCAERFLRILTKQKDVKLIMWTSTPDHFLEKYVEFFASKEIVFDYINCNPEVENTAYGDFTKKPYFAIGLDDKFGYTESDGYIILSELIKIYGPE